MNVKTLFRAKALKNVFGGDAIARVAGEVVFVPGVIAGEEFVGEITAVNKDYARAVVKELTKASPERVKPECSGMGRCPGCSYGHCSHCAEQAMKLAQLRDFLKPLNVDPELVQGADLEHAPASGYRNKIKLRMRKAGGDPQLGYVFADGRMYPVSRCLLAREDINSKLAELFADKGFIPSLHDQMTLTLRSSADGVTYFRNSAGKNAPLLREKVLGKDFMVPPEGFFQVNQHGMDTLCSLLSGVLQEIAPSQFIDAYAGAGLFGSVAAHCGVKDIVGVELEEASGRLAEQNWRNFGAVNTRFQIGDAAELMPSVLNDAPDGALAVFDPPRTGLEGKALRALSFSKLKYVVYVSCHPATLVRDLGRLQRGGFRIESVHLIDMFARSAHFESMVLLKRD